MKPVTPLQPQARVGTLSRLFPTLLGLYLGLTLLKFGNPPIMEKWVGPPSNVYEFLLGSPWPIGWAYLLLAGLAVIGLGSFRWRLPAAWWSPVLLLVWLTWQFVSALNSVDGSLTGPTLAHFVACAACYCLGCFCLSSTRHLAGFFAGLVIAYVIVLAIGFQQHFGGLEQTRRYFFLYLYPELKEVSPDYLKKISSPRIFSTLFYPNALAGAIVLLLPLVATLLAQARGLFTIGARCFLVSSVGLASLACLVWSGSKGGWLLLVFILMVAVLRLKFDRRFKVAVVAVVLLAGLTGFGLKYHSFFRKGATSVVARFDYWSAAIRTAQSHPIVGTGPGTFSRPYQALKRPESEMARLVHNDYLEQASDSGWIGFLAYTGFIIGSLMAAFPRRSEGVSSRQRTLVKLKLSVLFSDNDWVSLSIWLGVLGWAAQGLFEFGLYIPSLSWTAFCFLGLLVGRSQGSKLVDKPLSSR